MSMKYTRDQLREMATAALDAWAANDVRFDRLLGLLTSRLGISPTAAIQRLEALAC